MGKTHPNALTEQEVSQAPIFAPSPIAALSLIYPYRSYIGTLAKRADTGSSRRVEIGPGAVAPVLARPRPLRTPPASTPLILDYNPWVKALSRRSKQVTLPEGYSVSLPAPANPSTSNPFEIPAALGPIAPGGGRNTPEFIGNDFLEKFPDRPS